MTTRAADQNVWRDIGWCMDSPVYRRLNRIVESAPWQELVWDLTRPLEATVGAILAAESDLWQEYILPDASGAGSARDARG